MDKRLVESANAWMPKEENIVEYNERMARDPYEVARFIASDILTGIVQHLNPKSVEDRMGSLLTKTYPDFKDEFVKKRLGDDVWEMIEKGLEDLESFAVDLKLSAKEAEDKLTKQAEDEAKRKALRGKPGQPPVQ